MAADPVLQDVYRSESEQIRERFDDSHDGWAAVRERSDLIDQVLAQLWKRNIAIEIATRLQVSKLARDFLALVAAQGRADRLEAIAGAYRELHDEAEGRVRARVRTTVPLSAADRSALAGRLSHALGGKQVVLEEIADRELLGGFVAEVGSLLVDASLDGQLARMHRRLAQG